MGFLTASFSKMIYHRQKSSLQMQKTRIARDILRVQRQVSQMQKSLSREESVWKQYLQYQKVNAQQNLNNLMNGQLNDIGINQETGQYNDIAAANKIQQWAQAQLAQQNQSFDLKLSMFQESFDSYKDYQLQSLNDYEADLKEQQINIDTQLAFIDEVLKGFDPEIKDGAKSLAGGMA